MKFKNQYVVYEETNGHIISVSTINGDMSYIDVPAGAKAMVAKDAERMSPKTHMVNPATLTAAQRPEIETGIPVIANTPSIPLIAVIEPVVSGTQTVIDTTVETLL